jgi:hypothetical protein
LSNFSVADSPLAISAADALLRFVVPKVDFLGDDGRPTYRASEPSTADKSDAAARGSAVRVSVWNLAACTVVEALAAWNRPGYAEFTLLASDVDEAREHWNMPEVRVVSDPLPESGAAPKAHCGIEGLEKKQGEGKKYGIRLSYLTSRLQRHTP